MATYNGERYLIDQLKSIRDQTLPPDEVIICDDCSTDNTVKIVSDFINENALSEKWSLHINSMNKGYAKNFMDGIAMASGDVIYLADQDDIWFKEKIRDMDKQMWSNENILLLASNVMPFYEGYAPQKVFYEKFFSFKRTIKIKSLAKWIKPSRPGCTMCFRRELYNTAKNTWFAGYPHDSMLWGVAVLMGKAFVYNRCTMRFRRHDNNTSSRSEHTNNSRTTRIEREIKISDNMMQYVDKINLAATILLDKQNHVYRMREQFIKRHNVVGIMSLLRDIKYYAWTRYWLTDLYYCLKK